MSKYLIVTDSCCDMTKQEYENLGIKYAPLCVLYKGVPHDDFNDPAELKEFFNGLRSGETASTSAVNPDGWVNIMKPALEDGQDVLALCFSSGLSTTYQSAVIAAKELREYYPQQKILVVDTLTATQGQALLVTLACRKRDEGMGLEELAQWVEDNKGHVAHWLTVDDLNHLKRGGRISATTAFFGGMLNIKPIIHVDDEGHLINMAKARGRKASMEYLTKKMAETCIDFDTVAIGHADCIEDAEMLASMVKAQGVKNVMIGYIGGVIGAHTGPGAMVLCFMAKER